MIVYDNKLTNLAQISSNIPKWGYERGSFSPEAKLTEYFSVGEHQCKCGKCFSQFLDPYLYEKLDTVRRNLGYPLVINSGYRCSSHNEKVGGSKGSRHLWGEAVDIRTKSIHQSIEIAKEAVKVGLYGIGIYHSWVHLDSRDALMIWGKNRPKEVDRFILSIYNEHRVKKARGGSMI